MEPVLPFDLNLALGDLRTGGVARALHRQLRAAILEQRLPAGFALPSTRRLAEALQIGRNTVVAAYDLLVAEGFAGSRPGVCLVVTGTPSAAARAAAASKPPGASGPEADARIAAAWRQPITRIVDEALPPACSFRMGTPEHRYFNHAVWRRLAARALREMARLPFHYGPAQGLPALREAVAGHVAFVRAVACGPDDLVITAGAQQAFDLLARLLVTPGRTRVAVEDPGYAPLRAAFAAAGARLLPVPVDDQGLRVDRLPEGVEVICVTPSHQFPTGAVMPAQRRQALLARAQSLGAVVVEDDYDGEYLFDSHPQDALQTLDRDGRVFYVGTFSKSLFPALRKGFVVAPRWARETLVDIRRSTDSHGEVAGQATLAAFIAEGHLARHIRRMRPIYAQRRQALVRGLEERLGPWLQVVPGNAGLHLGARLRDPASAPAVTQAMRRHLPGALPLSAHAVGRARMHGVCIGYGSVEVDEIAQAIRAMHKALAAGA